MGERILNGEPFKQSSNDYDWLGRGIYFWEANPRRGLDFAREAKKRKLAKIKDPFVVGAAVLRARWIETVTIHLKKMGLSFDAIAEQITRFGRGQAQSIVAIPEGVSFGPDYAISRQACHKAFKKAIAREPSLAVDELRKLDNSRSEELFLNLQPSMRKGNPRAVEVGIKLLDLRPESTDMALPRGTN